MLYILHHNENEKAVIRFSQEKGESALKYRSYSIIY